MRRPAILPFWVFLRSVGDAASGEAPPETPVTDGLVDPSETRTVPLPSPADTPPAPPGRRIERPFDRPQRWLQERAGALVCAALAFLCCYLGSKHFENTPFDNYSLFANALVHHRLWIDWPGAYIDAVLWDGHRYIVNDPLPGVVLAPFAYFFGENTNQTLLGAFFTAGGCYFAYRLARRLGATPFVSTWLTAFYFAGSDLFWSASLGDVWFVAQVCAMTLLTAAIYEAMTRRRPVVVGILFSLAVFSRFTMVLSAPALAMLMVWRTNGTRLPNVPRTLANFAVTLLPFAVIYMIYNELRWGVPYDSGHTIFFHEDASAGAASGSPFSTSHLLYQLHSFFMQAPEYSDNFPYLIPGNGGVALTFTSPALILALRARKPFALIVALWLATFLAAGPSLLYYVNGYAQYGMRHAMDFEPYLYVLMILAVRARFSFLSAMTILWSFLAGCYGVWYWHAIDGR